EFRVFMEKLNTELLKLEFHQFPIDGAGCISARDFGRSVVAHVGPRYLAPTLQRLGSLPNSGARVSFSEFLEYNRMIREKSQDIAIAYRSFPSVHRGKWSKDEFKSVMRRVTDVVLSDAQVDVIFHLFDKDGDGRLDEREFYEYGVKSRFSRGLNAAAGDSSNPLSFKRIWNCVTAA
ncbi:hypothetical protein HK405_016060, partial [Cladochytrium tenue]